jgi:hypothetical protein
MISPDFLSELKRATEQEWNHKSLDSTRYGFQFQRGTRWNPGLSNLEILEYEKALGVRFPHDFRAFLSVMNGTDIPTLNVSSCRKNCRKPKKSSRMRGTRDLAGTEGDRRQGRSLLTPHECRATGRSLLFS